MLDNFKLKTAKQYNELLSDRDALVIKCKELENEVANLKNMSKDMTEAQAQHNNVIATMKTEHETALTSLKADYEKQISELNVKVTEEAASSEAKAIQTLAKIGVPVEELPQAKTPKVEKKATFRVIPFITNNSTESK